jgi:hypothetical protein
MDETRPTEVPVPEPDLKPEEMIARARALRSMVREEAEAAEQRGYYSEALHNEFVKAGFYRCLQLRVQYPHLLQDHSRNRQRRSRDRLVPLSCFRPRTPNRQ